MLIDNTNDSEEMTFLDYFVVCIFVLSTLFGMVNNYLYN